MEDCKHRNMSPKCPHKPRGVSTTLTMPAVAQILPHSSAPHQMQQRPLVNRRPLTEVRGQPLHSFLLGPPAPLKRPVPSPQEACLPNNRGSRTAQGAHSSLGLRVHQGLALSCQAEKTPKDTDLHVTEGLSEKLAPVRRKAQSEASELPTECLRLCGYNL